MSFRNKTLSVKIILYVLQNLKIFIFRRTFGKSSNGKRFDYVCFMCIFLWTFRWSKTSHENSAFIQTMWSLWKYDDRWVEVEKAQRDRAHWCNVQMWKMRIYIRAPSIYTWSRDYTPRAHIICVQTLSLSWAGSNRAQV